MSESITVYECGLRLGGKYSEFMQSRDENKIDDYIEVMKESCDMGEIVKYVKHFNCISVTPFIVRGDNE